MKGRNNMKVTDINGLFIGYNKEENFRILIAAEDKDEAVKVAKSYNDDSNLQGEFEVNEFEDVNTKFDCDYIIM